MLEKIYPRARSTRSDYAADLLVGDGERVAPARPSLDGDPIKQGGIVLLLVAVAVTVFLVLPDEEEAYSLESGEESETAAPEEPAAPSTSEATTDLDDQLALAADAAVSGAEFSLARNAPVGPTAEDMKRAKIAASSTTTTTDPTTTEARATTERPATTEAPTTTAPTSSDGSTSESSEGDTTSSSDGSSTSETTADDSSTSSSVDDSSTSSSVTTTTTIDDSSSSTSSSATSSTTAAGQAGWVDAGHGVMVPPVLLDIRFCESNDRYDAANPSSSARGAYQFLTSSWAAYGHKDRYGVTTADQATNAQQDEAALITWEADGTRPWLASKPCWSAR